MSLTAQAGSNGHKPNLVILGHKEISPSPTNPRKRFDDEALRELAASIKDKGILEPVLVRQKLGDGQFELIAGERRWRAAGIAGVEEVPAIVRVMTDEEVLDAQIHENLHRADIHPLDEALGYQHLLNHIEGLTIAELARRVAKNEEYVQKRLRLNSLDEEVVKDFADGLITLGHALEIARLAPESQKLALESCYEKEFSGYEAGTATYKVNKSKPARTVRHLRAWIEQHILLNLHKAPFKMDDARLREDGLTCLECPQRSGFNKALFDDIKGDDVCTNPQCFTLKIASFVQIKHVELTEKSKAKGKGTAPLISDYYSAHPDVPPGSILRGDFKFLEKKADRCEYAEQGIYSHGPGIGQVRWICRDKENCRQHWKKESSASSSSSTGSSSSRAQSPEDRGKRKMELFNARVAEPVRRRTLRAIIEKIEPATYADNEAEAVWPLNRSYFERMAAEDFLRISGSTRDVLFEVLDWSKRLDDIKLTNEDHIKTARQGATSHTERKVLKLMPTLTDTELLRFMVLCSIIHYGENLNIYGEKDQSQIIKLAEEHGVPYQLFDARERLKQNPGKKYYSTHSNYLLRVLLGEKGIKPPVIYAPNAKLDSIHSFELENKVKETVTLRPFVDGPNGLAPVEGAQDESKSQLEIANELVEVIKKCRDIYDLRQLRQTFIAQYRLRTSPLDQAHLSRIVNAFNNTALNLPGFLRSDCQTDEALKAALEEASKQKVVVQAKDAPKRGGTNKAAKSSKKKVAAKAATSASSKSRKGKKR